jgi:hypothetical protein
VALRDDSMQLLRELRQEVQNLKQVVSSQLDIQNKLGSCDSGGISPQLNDDIPLANFEKNDEIRVSRNYVIARAAIDMGADTAGMNWVHENFEIANISRARKAMTAKLLRSTISQSNTRITEDTGGFKFGRSKEAG